MSKKISVVIARYNEDVDWINKIKDTPSIEQIIIYNKGEDDIFFEDTKIKILCPFNIGREGGAYLDYIIDNYESFPENIIFTQADPFVHNNTFLNFLVHSIFL